MPIFVYADLEVAQAASTCPGENANGPRTRLRQDYADRNVGWQPACEELTQTVWSSSHYSFSTWNRSNTTANAALLREWLVGNTFCIVSNFGSVPTLNSGYRSPSDQIRIGGAVNNWNNARHVHGDAVDLDTPQAPNDAAYDELRRLAKEVGCGFACVEPRDRTPGHIHIDYRSTCPDRW